MLGAAGCREEIKKISLPGMFCTKVAQMSTPY